MRPRLPSLRPFSVGTGLFVGVAVGIVAHHLAPGVSVPGSDVGLAPAVGFLVLLAVWVALEQVPAVVDRLLLARGHYALVVVALAPVVVVLVGDASGVVTFTEATRLQTVGFTLIGLFATAATTGQRARLLRERESVAIAVEAVESRWRRLALTFLAFVLSYGAFGLVYPAAVSVWSFLGVVFGLGLGMLVVGEHRVELVALDSGLLVRAERGLGASVLPWKRLRRVAVEGETLSIGRGLPWPLVYRVDLNEVEDPKAVVETLRSRVDGR